MTSAEYVNAFFIISFLLLFDNQRGRTEFLPLVDIQDVGGVEDLPGAARSLEAVNADLLAGFEHEGLAALLEGHDAGLGPVALLGGDAELQRGGVVHREKQHREGRARGLGHGHALTGGEGDGLRSVVRVHGDGGEVARGHREGTGKVVGAFGIGDQLDLGDVDIVIQAGEVDLDGRPRGFEVQDHLRLRVALLDARGNRGHDGGLDVGCIDGVGDGVFAFAHGLGRGRSGQGLGGLDEVGAHLSVGGFLQADGSRGRIDAIERIGLLARPGQAVGIGVHQGGAGAV
ncbi:MAG: hypothetical protein IJL58_11030, partial [Bacteroidales bacterium]|nr:hypothetical protein [Bacteroidales bacterium]